MEKTNIAPVIGEIDSLIKKNLLQVTCEKYLVLIVEELWNKFDDESKQTTLLRNLLLYCKLKNAFNGIDTPEKQKLQLCVKNADQKVIALYELKNDKVEFINL